MENKPQFEDEINFRSVARSPLRWFGLIYPYFFVILLLGGLYYIKTMGAASQTNVPPQLTDSTNIFRDVKETKGGTVKGLDIKQAALSNAQVITKGKELFKNNCASCHGENGEGNGPAGAALNPKPRNFHVNEGWKNGRRISDIFTTLQKGIPGSAMPAFEYLPLADRFALIHFVRSLAPDYPKPTDQELAELDKTYNISQGTMASSQIPVSQALNMINEEALPSVQKVNTMIAYIDNNPNDPGSILFKRLSKDKVRTLAFLTRSDQWDSINDFIKTVISTRNVNGFNSQITQLTAQEWTELFNYLVKLKNS